MTDIRTLDLNLLRALDALLDERSVTRAASRLALTQPAVSGMLNRLREAFEDPLFVRTQRGVIPTQRAHELADPVKQVLAQVEAMLRAPLFDPAHAELTVSVAATDYALRVVVLPWLARLRHSAPGIRVAVRPIDEARLLTQFELGELDLALLTPETTPGELHARALFDEQYVCALRHDHPAAAGGALSLDAFCALDHVLVSYVGGAFRGATDAALEAIGRQRRVVLSVPNFLVLPELLRNTDLLAVVPRRMIAGVDGLALCEPPIAITGFTKIAAWHARTHHDAAHGWVRAQLFASCAPTPSAAAYHAG